MRNVDDGEKKDKQDKKRLVKIEVHLRRCQNSFERKGMQKVGFKRILHGGRSSQRLTKKGRLKQRPNTSVQLW